MTSNLQLGTSPIASDASENGPIRLHGKEAFEGMRKAGQLAARALDLLAPLVKPGVSTQRLDDIVLEFALDNKSIPAPLHYRGFPRAICTSINHVVCHGIPNSKPLRDGDILNIDVTLIHEGWYGDTSRMFTVGEVNRRASRLIEVTYEALLRGIAAAKPGNHVGDIGRAIQEYAEGERCSIVEEFCGHGLGRVFHDKPNILHYRHSRARDGKDPGEGAMLKPGMLFTIEPMINLGKSPVKILSDGWTAVTRDRELSAQFEHTVGITADGCEVFTHSPAGYDKPPYAVPAG